VATRAEPDGRVGLGERRLLPAALVCALAALACSCGADEQVLAPSAAPTGVRVSGGSDSAAPATPAATVSAAAEDATAPDGAAAPTLVYEPPPAEPFTGSQAPPPAGVGLAVGRDGGIAPDFVLVDHAGRTVSLRSLRGRIVVLEWVDWACPVVRRRHEAGDMEFLAGAYRRDGVVWLGVNSSAGSSEVSNARAAAEFGLDYPVLDDSTGRVARLYGARTTPHLFVIDIAGRIAYQGAFDDDPTGEHGVAMVNYVEEALRSLLVGEPVEQPRTAPYGSPIVNLLAE
jgi:peroxiredoxin